MSFQVIHFEKFTRGSVKGIEIHAQREKPGVSHTNPDINWKKTKNNFDLIPPPEGGYNRAVSQRISELNLPRAVRKDAVVLCGFVISSDKDFFKGMRAEKRRSFFQASFDFLADRYGRENIIAATVHMDESTPHMHLYLVPVTQDGRLSAKAIFNRQELQRLHSDFYAQVGREFGLQRGEGKEQGKRRFHLDTPEFKKYTEALNEARRSLQKAREECERIEAGIGPLRAEYEARRAFIDEMDKASQVSMMYPQEAKVTEKGLFAKQKLVTVPAEMWEARHISVNEKEAYKKALDALEARFEAIGGKELERKVSALQKEIKGLETTIRRKDYEAKQMKRELDATNDSLLATFRELVNWKSAAKELISLLPPEQQKEIFSELEPEKPKQSRSREKGFDLSR